MRERLARTHSVTHSYRWASNVVLEHCQRDVCETLIIHSHCFAAFKMPCVFHTVLAT